MPQVERAGSVLSSAFGSGRKQQSPSWQHPFVDAIPNDLHRRSWMITDDLHPHVIAIDVMLSGLGMSSAKPRTPRR
ncbi:hypothetical protein MESS2_1670037 [Mesorhizobium metallidurans STM 2683]|uniref:Uncharacterized protein n=1 Tax=Mesorhizobium metallidurans STM 2683 TaxID=1297569 RepID=M5ENU2_9HYPH|nr:hypothetical protein MESS2_1670037 [Mesorhizobium metallidurans STM 2683]